MTAASLPLASLLRKFGEQPPVSAAPVLQGEIERLQLEKHVSAVLVFSDGRTYLSLEAGSPLGAEVLHDTLTCLDFIPCDDAEHEMKNGACIWCGLVR